MPKILVTGFTPFDGRHKNASWVAASLLQASLPADAIAIVEIPVLWGAPSIVLQKAIYQHKPEVIIAMGEGKPACFQLETLAMNFRAQKQDNNDNLPDRREIIPGGPASVRSSAALSKIRNALVDRGMPVLMSLGAGGFLCEEALFVLEDLKHNSIGLREVMFVHLPPYATEIQFKGELRCCDEELLEEFVVAFYEICCDLYLG